MLRKGSLILLSIYPSIYLSYTDDDIKDFALQILNKPVPKPKRKPIPKPRQKPRSRMHYLLDRPIKDIAVEPLKPTKYIPPKRVPPPRSKKQAIKRKLNEFYDWLVDFVPKPIKIKVSDSYKNMKSKIMKLFEPEEPEVVKLLDTAMKGRLKTYVIKYKDTTDIEYIHPDTWLRFYTDTHVKKLIKLHENYKMELVLVCEMVKRDPTKDEIVDTEFGYFSSSYHRILSGSDIDEIYENMVTMILDEFIEERKKGSGCKLNKIKELQIHVVKYDPLKGSSYIFLTMVDKQKGNY